MRDVHQSLVHRRLVIVSDLCAALLTMDAAVHSIAVHAAAIRIAEMASAPIPDVHRRLANPSDLCAALQMMDAALRSIAVHAAAISDVNRTDVVTILPIPIPSAKASRAYSRMALKTSTKSQATKHTASS